MTLNREGSMAAVLVLALVSISWDVSGVQDVLLGKQQKEPMTQNKFYCNIKALNLQERAHHKVLTDKLLTKRSKVIETEKGYEFQYSPETVSLAELADWVIAESKCCPFFGFHIDLENEGKLICLRLTGEEGVKPFMRAEFLVPPKT